MNEDGPIPFIKEDGTPFEADDLRQRAEWLNALTPDERFQARNENATAIAVHDAARMLAVSGPGTGKSTLFRVRLQHWLEQYPEHRLTVATFVRKLVRDLSDDITNDSNISDEQKSRVSVQSLHSLARSVIERNHGTQGFPLAPHFLVISATWQEMVWGDAVSLGDASATEFPWKSVQDDLYDGVEPGDGQWFELRGLHLRLQQFYNALTFADLILLGAQVVAESPELVDQTLFIIDEFQDFNLADKALIERMIAGSDGVFLAGDDDQVLYDGLRRGHADIIRSYYRDPAWVNAMLPFCGRCDFHIVRCAEAFLTASEPTDSIEKIFLPLGTEEGAEKVYVVSSTTPASGVEFVERFIAEHRAGIDQRQVELKDNSEKDSYLLILTPAREMNFLARGGARDALRSLAKPYLAEDEQVSDEYWRLLDYLKAGRDPAQNFAVRKVLAHENISQQAMTELLRSAFSESVNLCDLDDDHIRACLARCEAVRNILEGDADPEARAEGIESLGGFGSAENIGHDLQLRPAHSNIDAEAETAEPEQSASTGAVAITTIVGAKGLSADHVIVLGCDAVNLGFTSRSAFFVALTRARKSLTLLACMGGGGASALHNYCLDLPEQHTVTLQALAKGVIKEFATVADLQSHLAKTAYAMRMAAEKRAEREGRQSS